MNPMTKTVIEVACKAAVTVTAQVVTARLLGYAFGKYDEWASRPAPLPEPAPAPVEPQPVPEPAPAAGGAL